MLKKSASRGQTAYCVKQRLDFSTQKNNKRILQQICFDAAVFFFVAVLISS